MALRIHLIQRVGYHCAVSRNRSASRAAGIQPVAAALADERPRPCENLGLCRARSTQARGSATGHRRTAIVASTIPADGQCGVGFPSASDRHAELDIRNILRSGEIDAVSRRRASRSPCSPQARGTRRDPPQRRADAAVAGPADDMQAQSSDRPEYLVQPSVPFAERCRAAP
jgi:hypothetical protein